MLRTYAGSASQHSLRMGLATTEEVQRYDASLVKCWEELVERPLAGAAVTRLGLPARLGGVGAQLAATRRNAAFLASWSAVAAEVTQLVGTSTLADCLDALPRTRDQLEEARAGLANQGAPLSEGAHLAEALRSPLSQGLLVARLQKNTSAALRQPLQTCQQAFDRG